MSIEQPNGSIMPAHVFVNPGQIASRNDPFFRVGTVSAVYYPANTSNYSQSFIEYDVLVDQVDPYGMHTKVVYPHCKVVSLFGGAADFTDWTYRLSTLGNNGQGQSTNGPANQVDYGSTVCVLCINGDVRQGIIIGGLKHAALPKNPNYDPTKMAGTHFEFEFNGLTAEINDDGELIVTFNGKTDADGQLNANADSALSGSSITFDKKGSLAFLTAQGIQNIILNNESQETRIQAKNLFGLDVTQGRVQITSQGVSVGAATDAWMLGSTYREQQALLDNTIAPLLASLGGVIGAAGAALTAASALTSFTLAAPGIATAGASLTSAVAMLTQVAEAFVQFEALSEQYLSKNNLTD